jgi:sigma-B regulation protein RsbU (phosphoserine phosphatase)
MAPPAAPPRPAPPDAAHLDAALAPADQLGALLLTLMSRLLATRGVGALADGDGLRVAAVKGPVGLAAGRRLAAGLGDDLPPALREAGLSLAVPLEHGGETVGLLALGPRATGKPYGAAEVGLARSLAGATAASVRAGRAATALAEANRRQQARAQELRTLFELSQAFGRALDREAILNRLGFALMGQLLVSRFAVALCDSDDDREADYEVTFGRGAEGTDAVPCALADLDGPCPLESGTALAEAGWEWAVPLRAGDVTRGVVLLGPRAAGRLDGEAADFAAALAALAVGALETADRVADRVERERLREEVRLAREVQRSLLPAALPEVAGLEVAVRWRPSRDVSGDTYEAAALPGGRLLVAVADVVGKGIGASLLMATLQAGLRLLEPDLAGPDPDLAAVTARLDRLVARSTEPHQFVTLAWAVADPPGPDGTARLRYVVAGHPPPRLVRADGRVEALTSGGPLLGVLPDPAFRQGEARLGPGDALVLYTDGATEAQDARGEELEVGGLDRALCHAAPDAAGGLLDAVVAAVDAWADGAAEADDLTLLAVRVAG